MPESLSKSDRNNDWCERGEKGNWKNLLALRINTSKMVTRLETDLANLVRERQLDNKFESENFECSPFLSL